MTDRRTNLTPKHVEELTILSENVDKVDNILQCYQLQNQTLNLTLRDFEAWAKIAVNNDVEEREQSEDDTEDDSDDEEDTEDENDEMPALVPRS